MENEDQTKLVSGHNLWDLIKLISSTNTEEVSNSTVEQIENGVFFSVLKKTKGNEVTTSDNPEHKTLQVFSQKMPLGSKHITMTTVRDMSQVLEL